VSPAANPVLSLDLFCYIACRKLYLHHKSRQVLPLVDLCCSFWSICSTPGNFLNTSCLANHPFLLRSSIKRDLLVKVDFQLLVLAACKRCNIVRSFRTGYLSLQHSLHLPNVSQFQFIGVIRSTHKIICLDSWIILRLIRSWRFKAQTPNWRSGIRYP